MPYPFESVLGPETASTTSFRPPPVCPARRRTGSTVRPAPAATELWSPQASDRGFGSKTGPYHYDKLQPRATDKIAAWDPSAPVAAPASAAKNCPSYAAEALWWRGPGASGIKSTTCRDQPWARICRGPPRANQKNKSKTSRKMPIPSLSHDDRPRPSPIVRRMSATVRSLRSGAEGPGQGTVQRHAPVQPPPVSRLTHSHQLQPPPLAPAPVIVAVENRHSAQISDSLTPRSRS